MTEHLGSATHPEGATPPVKADELLSLREQLEAVQAECDRLREGVNDAADILDVIGKWFTAGADTSNMDVILNNALPLMEKWEAKLAAISNSATALPSQAAKHDGEDKSTTIGKVS